MSAIFETQFKLPKQTAFYRGKVRDVYTIGDEVIVMVASDRISAFDVVMPKPIPFKGQVLNQIAAFFLQQSASLVPNWLISSPHPYVSIGYKCSPIRLEMVIRGYLAGHAWRTYQSGLRTLCGVSLAEGLKESAQLPSPIITPATKADEGHDEDISEADILKQKIVDEATWQQLKDHTHKLFDFGTQHARKQGLLLVDTKYEFGTDKQGQMRLIDEIHTPDSSRYYYAEGYADRYQFGERQRQLSKEFVREWLIENHFMGKAGQEVPIMPDAFIDEITQRYIELYEQIIGSAFKPVETQNLQGDIEEVVRQSLKDLGV